MIELKREGLEVKVKVKVKKEEVGGEEMILVPPTCFNWMAT